MDEPFIKERESTDGATVMYVIQTATVGRKTKQILLSWAVAVADPDGGLWGFNPSFLVGVAPFLSKWY